MKKNIGWILTAIVLVGLIWGASALYQNLGNAYSMDQLATQTPPVDAQATVPGAEQTEPEKKTAPDFTVVDRDGNEVKLSDFFGKPIVLNFWASWCGPCRSEMPDFDAVWARMGDEVQFLMVNVTDGSRETAQIAADFVEEAGFGFPVYYDVHSDAAYTYGVSSLPTTYFIASDGTLTAYGMGAIDEDTLLQGISMIYSEE